MKKNLLLMLLCCPMILAAQGNGVTVSNLAVSVGSPTTVTFNVSWKNTGMPALWSDTVWVFVDYNNAGKMERLPLSTGATLTATSAPGVGKVIEETGNNQGVWVEGNARTQGSFSATVKLLTAVKDVGGACVYGSNYPPVGEYKNNATEISFTGTPMYEIALTRSGGGTATVRSGDTFLLPCDYTLTSFTDATGAPGIIKCIPMVGDIDFIVPAISKNNQATFVVDNSTIDITDPVLITYSWSAPDFNPTTYEGTIFTSTAPETSGTYSITLTAHREDYCDLSKTKNVEVSDCTAPGSTVNFTAFEPCSNAMTGDYWYLTDTRLGGNNNTYKIKKMHDDHIWMVQDLKFGTCPNSTASWYNDNSEAATTHSPTVYAGYVGHCRATSQANAGYLYNWPAAMQNKKAYYGSSDNTFQCTGTSGSTCQGICPAGWHMPTGNTGGEFYNLHNVSDRGCSTSNDNCWDASSDWEGVYNGDCFSSGSLNNQGGHASYWSSSKYTNNNRAYSLYFSSASTGPGISYFDKSEGRSVRCVRNY